jgi:hypothetical protein
MLGYEFASKDSGVMSEVKIVIRQVTKNMAAYIDCELTEL